MFQTGSFWLKRRGSWDENKKQLLIEVTGVGICRQHFLHICYGYLTEENRVWLDRNCSTVTWGRDSQQYTFRRNRKDTCIIHFNAEDISSTTPVSHESDSEKPSDDQSQSGGGLPSPPTHSLQRSSHELYQPNRYDTCTCMVALGKRGDVVDS